MDLGRAAGSCLLRVRFPASAAARWSAFSYARPTGPAGADGETGPTGQGVPTGGTSGQVLAKVSGTDYDTEWITISGGGSTGTQLYTGDGVPNSNLGNTNDLYINTTSAVLYKKGIYSFSSPSLLLDIDNYNNLNDEFGIGIAIDSVNKDV